ncbi:MlaD family protein [Paraconexibacter sp.]|uniref:MlaD family protein n=1 Tax=Paraconexibacter sp. TaxID=2949640 RepID=UPI003568BA20
MATAQAPRVDIDPGQGDNGGGGRLRRTGAYFIDHPWVIVGIIAFVVFALWVYGTRTQKHEIRAVFSEAVSVYSGLDVRVDGLDAGKVKKIENVDGQAIITLGIDDDRVWPLHRGTKAVMRFGSTIGNGTRIIDIEPGPKTAPELPDGGIITNKDTVEATEFDQIFDTFDGKTRASLQSMLEGTGGTFGPRQKELGEAVTETGPGLEAVGGFADDLVRDAPALRAFVANTNRVTRTLAARRNDLSGLVQVAASTFNEFARNTTGIKGSLDEFAPAMRETRSTLARLDTSVGHLDALLTDLKPGARELGGLAKDLRPSLASLRRTVPVAVQTFRTARQASPAITSLLERSQPFSAKATPALADLAPMVGCIRPYAPEMIGLMTVWASMASNFDGIGHYGRIQPNTSATASSATPPVNSGQFTQLTGQGYALTRPPGYQAGKSWFIPECGITPDGIDPTKDPSDR